MVRRNKSKTGGKVSGMMKTGKLSNPTISSSNSLKNTLRTPARKSTTQSKMNFYNKYCNNKVQQNLVDAMNILIDNMSNSKNKNEIAFIKSLKKNSKMLPFLALNKNTNKLSMTMTGGADGDETPNGEQKCSNSNVVTVVRQTPPVTTTGIQAIQEQITQVNDQLTAARSENNQVAISSLVGQLQNLSMIETMARQRQQAIDIVNRRENWNMAGDLCNRAIQLIFTGLSGYLAYLVLALFQNAGNLITSGAGGLIVLFCVVIVEAVSNIVNGMSGIVPSWLGGGAVMGSGREIVEGITEQLNSGIQDTPELNNIITQLNELGYTANIIAFIILFIFFNVVAHIARIFMTSTQFSIGFTGVSVAQQQRQQALPALQPPPVILPTPSQPTPVLENQSQTQSLEDTNPAEVNGGYKSKKHKSKKHKSKKHKSKKHKSRKHKSKKHKSKKHKKRNKKNKSRKRRSR